MLDIYRYKDLSLYLADTLSERKTKNPRFSLRAWAKQLGQRTPSLLSDVLHG